VTHLFWCGSPSYVATAVAKDLKRPLHRKMYFTGCRTLAFLILERIW
jgi:hypothetical protein